MNRVSITHEVKPVNSFFFFFLPFANKATSKVFEKGLALMLAVMAAVQIAAESGLVEDHHRLHFFPPSGCELAQICDVNSSVCVMPV